MLRCICTETLNPLYTILYQDLFAVKFQASIKKIRKQLNDLELFSTHMPEPAELSLFTVNVKF